MAECFPEKSRILPDIPETRFTYGLRPLKGGFSLDAEIIGFDTETLAHKYLFSTRELLAKEKGVMFPDIVSFQISGEKTNYLQYVEFKGGLNWFIDFFPKAAYVFAHNLEFDLGALLGDDFLGFTDAPQVIDFDAETKIEGKINSGIMSFARFYVWKPDEKGKWRKSKTLFFIDTANFFGKRKLDTIAKEQFPNSPELWKLEKPDYLGLRLPESTAEREYFEKYAIQDAEVTRRLGVKICEMFKRYNIRLRPTPASFSIAVFRKDFLRQPLLMLNYEDLRFSWDCYNGGRFEAFSRGLKENIFIYDYNSLYPYAATFPLPLSRTHLDKFTLNEFENNPDIVGFYKCDFEFPAETVYPSLPVRNDKLFFPLSGDSFGTLYELKNALKQNAAISNCKILGFIPDKKEIAHPLAEFMRFFYAEKQKLDKAGLTTQAQKELRNSFKLILNSSYGKFAERHKDKEGVVNAGTFFNPPIASLITGKSRAILGEALVKYKPLYCDTDSLVTTRPIKENIGFALGELKEEIHAGKIVIINPKQYYVTYEKNGEMKRKIACHSFGNPSIIEKAVLLADDSGVFKYERERFLKPKEAAKRRLQPRSIITQKFKTVLTQNIKRIYHKPLNTMRKLVSDYSFSEPLKRKIVDFSKSKI